MRIGIIVAMDSELESIKSILESSTKFTLYNRNFLEGTYNNHRLIVCVGGIGKVNAAITATLMDACFDCNFIISTGCAGGISSDLNVGDIVVAADYAYHDIWCPLTPDTKMGELQGLPTKLNWKEVISTIFDCKKWLKGYKVGHFYSGDQFIQNQDAVNKIIDIYKDDVNDGLSAVCDMESMAIAHTCYQLKIPFISFRVISDTPCCHIDAEEQMKQYENFWKSMSDKSYNFLKSFIDSYKD